MKNIFKFIVHGFLILIPTIFHSSLSHAEVSFRVMPEFPYSDEEFFLIDKELKNTKKSTKFIINMGSKTDRPNPTNLDFSCDEERYKNLHDLLKQSTVPVFIVPGANVYWPCQDELKLNPLWEKYFFEFEKNWKYEFLVQRQKEQKENFSFFLENTLFIGINLFEKRGRSNLFYKKILENNIFWIKQNLNRFGDKIESIVIFAHTFSGRREKYKDNNYIACGGIQVNSWDTHKKYKYFSEQFVSLAKKFKKPILYIHDNSHCGLYDSPYFDAGNIKRIITDSVFNSPFIEIKINDQGIKVDPRKDKRIDLFIKDANLGDVWPQYFLGKEYLKNKDYKNAKKWLTKASNKNFPPAMLALGVNFGKEKKYTEAFELFNSIMSRNRSYAKNDEFQVDKKNQIVSWENRIKKFKNKKIKDTVFLNYFYLGSMFAYGFGVPINYIKALEYYKIASEGNIGMSHYKIALMHYKGLGIRKDLKKAIDWFKKAASTGIHEAQFTLGTIYLRGEGVRQNYKEAAKWFKKGTNFGPNIFELGILYWKGLGVKQDRKAAIQYFKKAAKFGIKEAIQTLENLGEISTNTE